MLSLALLLAGLARFPAIELQPRTVVSPSGGWSLRIEPLTRDGTGEADYTLTGGGREAWRKRHPFALWDAEVTDDGRVGGFAYVDALPEMPAGGSLHVVVLSPKGEVLLDDVHERVMSRVQHGVGEPYPVGMFVQHELGRLVVRIAAGSDYRSGESWWAYDLASGKALFREHPTVTLGLDSVSTYAVRAIPETPLVLVHWYAYEFSPTSRAAGGLFHLLDAERRSVWRLELPHDYEIPGDRDAEGRLIDDLRTNSAILATGSREFELRHAAEGQRVSYSVAGGKGGSWEVTERRREPFAKEPVHGTELATLTPKLLKEIALGGALPPPPEIRDVLAFGFDDQSRLRFARREAQGATLVQLDEDGDVRHAQRVPAEIGDGGWLSWFPLASPSWIAVAANHEEGVSACAWRVDEETGAYAELAGFPGQDVRRVAPLSDGRVVVLSTWNSSDDTLSAYDGKGRTLWTVAQEYEDDPAKLFSPEDVAVTADGKVVVLDNIRNVLQVFSGEGRYLETIELAAAWGQEPGYPASIVPDRDAGVLILDSSGQPPLWRMSLDGRVHARLAARTVGGEPREEYAWAVRVAPDGRLWTTDGHEFVSLDEQGIADLTLGAPARLDWLESPGSAAIDSTFGRLLIQDDRTKAVHVFDAEGRRVTVARPRAEELEELDHASELLCDWRGRVLASEYSYTKPYRCFSSDGTSLGPATFATRNVAFAPGREAYWGVDQTGLVRIGPVGNRELELPKRPDGRWWRVSDMGVAADGTLVVLDSSVSDGLHRERGEALVVRIDTDGATLGQNEVPESVRAGRVASAGSWVLLWSGASAWLLDTRDGTVHPIELEAELDVRQPVDWGLSPSGTELWVLLPRARKLRRYALPS